MSKDPSKLTTATAEVESSASTSTTEPKQGKPSNFLKNLFHKDKTDSSPSSSTSEGKRESISASGPYTFVPDPLDPSKQILQKNPHWPNEDSYKEVEATKGTWAMGGEMGNPRKDFGGALG